MSVPTARSDWNDGYISDVAYTDGYYAELAPVHLNYIALLNDCQPRALDRPFTYCELGCGNGHTVTLLAAAYPHAQFYAVDFNPAHVAKARQWAESAGVKNLTVLEASFQDLNSFDLPEFDFIVFHGIYSWISEINRKAILDVITRRLLPGGLVYNSYNCYPGWASQAPVQRLMLEIGRETPGDSLTKAAGAYDFVQKLAGADSQYLKTNESAANLVKRLATRPRSYVAHEYLNGDWHPFYCLDVFREMAMAKLSFLGSAKAPDNHGRLMFRKEGQALVDAQPTRDRKQLVQDFLINQQFRCDVYVKGFVGLSARGMKERLNALPVGLVKPAAKVEYTARFRTGVLNYDNDMSRAMVSILSRGPMTVGELAAQPELAKIPDNRVHRGIHTLISAGQIVPFAKSSTGQSSSKAGSFKVPAQINRHVIATAMEPGARGLLVSEVAGHGLRFDLHERCFIQAMVNGRGDRTPEAVWQRLEKHRLPVKNGDEILKGREAGVQQLQKDYAHFKTDVVPLLVQLGIVHAS